MRQQEHKTLKDLILESEKRFWSFFLMKKRGDRGLIPSSKSSKRGDPAERTRPVRIILTGPFDAPPVLIILQAAASFDAVTEDVKSADHAPLRGLTNEVEG